MQLGSVLKDLKTVSSNRPIPTAFDIAIVIEMDDLYEAVAVLLLRVGKPT